MNQDWEMMTEKLVHPFTVGDRTQSDLLGGKGANLAEMVRIGLPVPPGFTITTQACREYLSSGTMPEALQSEIASALKDLEKSKAVLVLYENNKFSQKAAADAIVGAITVDGKLPVSTNLFKLETGLELKQKTRIQYINPEDLGIYNRKLQEIDSIAKLGIRE